MRELRPGSSRPSSASFAFRSAIYDSPVGGPRRSAGRHIHPSQIQHGQINDESGQMIIRQPVRQKRRHQTADTAPQEMRLRAAQSPADLARGASEPGGTRERPALSETISGSRYVAFLTVPSHPLCDGSRRGRDQGPRVSGSVEGGSRSPLPGISMSLSARTT